MKINSGNLRTLGTGFQTRFQGGLGQAEAQADLVATVVPSSTGSEEYGWLGKVPNVREWLGDRVVNNATKSDYKIKNRDFELTMAVDRNDIEDDNLGIYGPLFEEMGRSSGAFPSQLVFGLLKNGFNTACYDGQYFFDTDHPVLGADGVTVNSVSNVTAGAAAPWFLMDLSRAIRPIILQKRKDFQFVPMDNPDDPNVFHKKQFLYGVDARMNVGFGFWQFAFASKTALDTAGYAAAFTALEGLKGDMDRPLGIRPTHLVVPPVYREAAQRILNNENDAAGASNPWKGSAKLEVVPWLA
ncbi:MAG: Mu-like prophage major head subunit gpT family protein [Sphingomicrobium sp.]